MTLRRFALASTASLLIAAPALAQSSDTIVRINQLESQVRELNGRIEELNFFILQMQEELRRQKEDNEFRFQDLEQRSDAGPAANVGVDETDTASIEPPTEGALEGTGDETVFAEPEGSGNDAVGEAPRDLGTLTFEPGALDLAPEFAGDTALAAAIEGASDDAALLQVARDFAASGEADRAVQVLEVHARRYPNSGTAAPAALDRGRALLERGENEEAAEIMLDAHERFSGSAEAPDLLLGVGTAMARIGNRDIACATFDEVDRLYPLAGSQAVGALREARAGASC